MTVEDETFNCEPEMLDVPDPWRDIDPPLIVIDDPPVMLVLDVSATTTCVDDPEIDIDADPDDRLTELPPLTDSAPDDVTTIWPDDTETLDAPWIDSDPCDTLTEPPDDTLIIVPRSITPVDDASLLMTKLPPVDDTLDCWIEIDDPWPDACSVADDSDSEP